MNKEKVVGLSDRLNEIVDEANRHPNGTSGFITWDKAVYAIEAFSKEFNSKIIMPKVFDEWDCEEHECCDCCEMEIENLISMYFKNDLASGYLNGLIKVSLKKIR